MNLIDEIAALPKPLHEYDGVWYRECGDGCWWLYVRASRGPAAALLCSRDNLNEAVKTALEFRRLVAAACKMTGIEPPTGWVGW